MKLSKANEAIPSNWTKGSGYFIGEFPVQHADGLAQLEAALLLGVMLIVCTILLACYYDWKWKLSFIDSYCAGVVMSSIVKFRTDCLVNTYADLHFISVMYMWSYICSTPHNIMGCWFVVYDFTRKWVAEICEHVRVPGQQPNNVYRAVCPIHSLPFRCFVCALPYITRNFLKVFCI